MHALKSLNYFDDVDSNDWPELLKYRDINWDKIMNFIDDACADYIKTLS